MLNRLTMPHSPAAALPQASDRIPPMQAVILSIGDELVLGQTVDTNSALVAARLTARGIFPLYHQTVADDQPAIARAISQAAKAAPLVLITGGLGPTADDLTRHALAEAMAVPLTVHQESLEVIRTMLERRGRRMSDLNRVQAMHPQGSTMIPNACGTAPGIKARLGEALIYVMPGVPREMIAMLDFAIEPDLDAIAPRHATGGRVILTTKINTFGCGESNVAEMLGDLFDRKRNPLVGTTVSEGIVSVRIRSDFNDPQQAQAELEDTAAKVQAKLGAICFGQENVTLQEVVLDQLKREGKTLAVVESCTGGLLGKFITDVPGSSAVFLGGWVTYSNAMKARELNVPAALLETPGAVSEEVAKAMAQGALHRSGADAVLSVTGVAGPEGGTQQKPVGTVWIGLARRGCDVEARCFFLLGDRDAIRDRAAKSALQMLRLRLNNASLDALMWTRPVVK